MFKTGIVSVTYRHLSSDETISAARSAGLEAIEWGGDIHVPPENIGNARAVGEATRAAGLEVVSYGTYYRLGENGRNFEVKFAETLAAAKALGAPSLRIWAGSKDACDTGEAERKELVRELRVCADMAAREGERIALEFHQKTLTSDADSAERLVGEVGRENLSLYWQPNQFLTFERNIENLTTVLPFISKVHVFAWEGCERLRLAEHRERWRRYLDILAAGGRSHALLLEFVPNDDPAVLHDEAAELKRLIIGG